MQETAKKTVLLSPNETESMNVNRSLNQKGVSLVEAVIASVIVSALAFGSAAILSDGAKISNFTDFQNVLNQIHNYDSQKVRNMPNLRIALAPILNSAEPCYQGMARAPAGGSNCLAAAQEGTLASLFSQEANRRTVDNAMVASDLTYRVECTAEKCPRIVLTVTTRPTPEARAKNHTAAERVTQIAFPLAYIRNKASIDFDCARNQGRPLLEIDYNTLRTNCQSFAPPSSTSQCALDMPLKGYGGTSLPCQQGQTVNCGNRGVKSVGMLVGQATSTCN